MSMNSKKLTYRNFNKIMNNVSLFFWKYDKTILCTFLISDYLYVTPTRF